MIPNERRTIRKRYRESREVIYLILSEIEQHSPDCRYISLLYVSNGYQVMKYVKELIDIGMITERREIHFGQINRFFKMTQTGIALLRRLEEMDQLLPFKSLYW